MSEGRIRVGIGGWTFAPWRGTFYPKNLPQKRELEFASRQVGVIEINATFYSRQSPRSWEGWAKAVPEDFEFAVKGSRFCVTRPRLAEAGEGLANFFAQGLAALGKKLGPVMWQFAPTRKFDPDDIASFIDLLPRNLGGIALRHVIEPRNESFRDDKFFALCRARNIAIALEDSDDYPTIDMETADFSYARLERMREDVPTGYDKKAIDRFAAKAERWRKDGRDGYVLMVNGAKIRAPAAALALQERLR